MAILERERMARGWSQTQFAGRTSVSQSQYSQIVSGRKMLRWWQFAELCEALEMPASRIIAEAEAELERERAAEQQRVD